ncbi:MAG: translational GTPase TypA [Planctomycetota bacterium]
MVTAAAGAGQIATAETIRNIAIVAHVDHGKTTLVDRMLYQSGMFRTEELDKLAGGQHGLIFDSNPIERERGITIFSKNCALHYTSRDGRHYKINIIDTPGHADFGGEVERVLSMADGVLLLVDSFEGPMPQTRFVLQKALAHRLKPIVIVNKADRPDARPEDVVNEVFDLFVELNANDSALDFPTIFASGRDGWATLDLNGPREDLRVVFEAVIHHVPAPLARPNAPLQMLFSTLEYSEFVGRIGVGKVHAGKITEGQTVTVIDHAGEHHANRVQQLLVFEGLGKRRVKEVNAGDLCAVVGLDPVDIGVTVADPDLPSALPPVTVDEPTLHMTFRVNDGPFAGQEGDYVTTRQIRERLDRELQTNVALRVAPGDRPEEFRVSGRGLMHLGILLENMRREGFELCAGRPRVVFKEIDGKSHEPIELLVVECPIDCQSAVMSLLGNRRAELVKMDSKVGASGFLHLEFTVPARGLIGLRTRMLTATQGRAIMHHTFHSFQPVRGAIPERTAGVLIASEGGLATAYALDALYDRGTFFIRPGDRVYEGQIIGENCKEGDLVVNPIKTKKLTNIRAAGKDDATQVRPVREMSLEAALEYIQDGELVEITPSSIRVRKVALKEADRRRTKRQGKDD